MTELSGQAYWLEGSDLVSGRPEDFFSFLNSRGHVISVVGGGGKTTLVYYLAECFARRKMRCAVMTTTRMGCPETICATMEECLSCWDKGEYAVCGEVLENGKFSSPKPDFLETLLDAADAIVIEADGAHRRPCKAPADHEPVILDQTDIVIGVIGIDALGHAVEDVCHRPAFVKRILGCDDRHVLSPSDLVRILLSDSGTRKQVGDRAYYTVLNKCDNEQTVAKGKEVLQLLSAQGHERAVLTHGIKRSEQFEFIHQNP